MQPGQGSYNQLKEGVPSEKGFGSYHLEEELGSLGWRWLRKQLLHLLPFFLAVEQKQSGAV